jgi:hypothetical protein
MQVFSHYEVVGEYQDGQPIWHPVYKDDGKPEPKAEISTQRVAQDEQWLINFLKRPAGWRDRM